MSKAFLVHKMKTELAVNVLGHPLPLTVADLADGCVGISLWFDTIEHAVEYGGADAEYSQGEVSDLAAPTPLGNLGTANPPLSTKGDTE